MAMAPLAGAYRSLVARLSAYHTRGATPWPACARGRRRNQTCSRPSGGAYAAADKDFLSAAIKFLLYKEENLNLQPDAVVSVWITLCLFCFMNYHFFIARIVVLSSLFICLTSN